jgi:hypothetical protein
VVEGADDPNDSTKLLPQNTYGFASSCMLLFLRMLLHLAYRPPSLQSHRARQHVSPIAPLHSKCFLRFHKAVCELMINDYSRRGWVDARGLRLPVIVVRPGAPNAALTGAWSSVVREPLNGEIRLAHIELTR